jgi:outer membrane lipoprotein-sorting protein
VGRLRRFRWKLSPKGCRELLLIVVLLPGRALHAAPQEGRPPGELTAEQILARMMEVDRQRTAELEAYTCTRRYVLENKRFKKRAEMLVRASFRQPGRKSFEILSESGSAAVRRRVFRKMIEAELEASGDELRDETQITPRNYDFRLLGTENLEGRRCYVFAVTPKKQNRFLIQGRVWVDAEDFAIARVEGAPAKNPSVWIRKTAFVHRYGKFGPFWLAVSNQSETDVVIFGRTQVRIEYFGHQIQAAGQKPLGQRGEN